MKIRVLYEMFNYFRRQSAAVLYDGTGYRFRIGNYISIRYEKESEAVKQLVKREFYLN